MLHNAVTGEGPGFYISPNCRYLLDTLPEAPRDDISLKYNLDHALDATSYLIRELHAAGKVQGTFTGFY